MREYTGSERVFAVVAVVVFSFYIIHDASEDVVYMHGTAVLHEHVAATEFVLNHLVVCGLSLSPLFLLRSVAH